VRNPVPREVRHARRFGTASSARRTATLGEQDDLPIAPSAELAPGAHLIVRHRGYTHHGIYVGGGKVVHYAGFFLSFHRGPVEEIALEDFASGRPVAVRREKPARYAPERVVERARSRLGEDRYRITTNNCEHFCEWCLRGESRSRQVERFIRWPGVVAVRAFHALRQVARVRPTAGSSAA
jgi:hypothetical protein